MRKSLIAVLLCVAVFYLFFVEIDETVLIATVPQQGEDNRPADPQQDLSVTTTKNLPGLEDQDFLNAMLMRELAQSASKTSHDFNGYIDPLLATVVKYKTPGNQGEKTAAFRQLVDHNIAQLYIALWQTLEGEELGDADFQAFVLATLMDLGDQAPGEILAALVQTAPTPELRLGALRLLAEASQELSVGPFRQALDHPDPLIRGIAQALFDEISANALLGAVATAVQDRNHAVRMAAFTTLEDMSEFAPVWLVANTVLDDPDPQIRMRALELLTYGDHQTANDRLVLALSDPNPDISNLAGDLLIGLEEARS